jgi:hypothetical protein
MRDTPKCLDKEFETFRCFLAKFLEKRTIRQTIIGCVEFESVEFGGIMCEKGILGQIRRIKDFTPVIVAESTRTYVDHSPLDFSVRDSIGNDFSPHRISKSMRQTRIIPLMTCMKIDLARKGSSKGGSVIIRKGRGKNLTPS